MEKNIKIPKFTFIVHWVENWNLALRWSQSLRKNPDLKIFWLILWPIFALMSVFYLFGKKSHEVIDEFTFANQLNGEIRILRNFGWHFFVKSQRAKIRQRILDAVLTAQDEGSWVIGLGALTKAEWLTAGGKWIVDTLGNRLRVPVVHGDTLTAAAICKILFAVLKISSYRDKVFLTGSTSKIGRAIALVLAGKRVYVRLYTSSDERFWELKQEAGKFSNFLLRAESLEDGADCKVWVTGKAVPSGQKLLKFIPEGATIVNFSVPNPIESNLLKRRPDLLTIEGGILAYDPRITDFSFTMRLPEGLTYACHAGTMVHAAMGWTHHEVGPVDLRQLTLTWEAAEKLGFFIPEFEVFRGKILAGGVNPKIRLVPAASA